MITLEPISPANALVFKAVRLRALQNDPTAFGSTYEKEVKLADEEWFRRAVRWSSDGCTGYIAFDREHACGLVAAYTSYEDMSQAHVISMWVDPAYRRTGVGLSLIENIRTWAAGRGLRTLQLMVTSVNAGAIRFYERLGFRSTGKIEPYPNDPAIVEHEMLMTLDS